MQVSDQFDRFKEQGMRLLKQGAIGSIEFSGRTYQIQVVDRERGEEFWPFLQFYEDGRIKDCFCSCPRAEQHPSCEHLSAAFLRIYHSFQVPLHQRFKESLWSNLCELFAFRLGCETRVLDKKGEGYYVALSSDEQAVFFLRGKSEKSRQFLHVLLEERKRETEETSLKFSDLDPEEIALWKEGRPRMHLRYELSFWSDLAKALMLRQENGDGYEISFRYTEDGIPCEIWVEFDDLSLAFSLSSEHWPQIIPTLNTVNSPLSVYNFNEGSIEEMTYDASSKSLKVLLREGVAEKRESITHFYEGVPFKWHFGDWLFIPEDGFYFHGKHGLLSNSVVEQEDMAQVLEEHFFLIQRHLLGTRLHNQAVPTCYEIYFDEQWNLYLKAYLFEKGDLQKQEAAYFGNWAYLESGDLYRLRNAFFETDIKVISSKEVSKFVHQYRTWLNGQEGFHTHLSSMEDQLTYFFDERGLLQFQSEVELSGESFEGRDFGDWVYIKGQGFYTKMRERIGLPVRPGVKIPSDEIESFIKLNREDLLYVQDFFNEECPVVRAGLRICFQQAHGILITPEYDLLPNYSLDDICFFGSYVYAKGKGFKELPLPIRLPEEYQKEMWIRGDRMALFLAYELDALKKVANHIDVEISKGVDPRFIVHDVEGYEDFEEQGRLNFCMTFATEFGKVPIYEVWEGLRASRRFLFSSAGLIDLTHERFDWLRKFGEHRIFVEKSQVKMSVLEFLRLSAFERVDAPPEDFLGSEQSLQFLQKLRSLQVETSPNLKGLLSSLRPYQSLGVDWLWFLYNHHLSGLLCDDMGLGKTHQAMALLCAAGNQKPKKQRKKGKKYFLVVCPTSVIYHWQEKLQEFLPHLNVCTFHGAQRSLDGFLSNHDLLLTSYGILRREKDMIGLISFDVAIFDEVQVAKNHQSKLHASLLKVQAKMRLGLTGTPLENQVRELKALFDVVLPHYMPGESQYKEYFTLPIEKMGSEERKKQLGRFVKPFLLRRKKEDVLQDLPEKTEELSHCELSLEQMKLYQEILAESKERLLAELSNEANPVPYIHVFALLMKLKQLCNHPALVLQDLDSYHQHESGKWDLFVELLSQARESGQKVVVFSQYLGMLDIIEKYLKSQKIGYASIRGATVERGREIQRFRQDSSCEVFVASLLTAGLGIDLTAGSVVIHYDRWWNAARENQATDRVHRIGQTRGVQVFKLVTLGTIEEKIDAIISRKGTLMEELIASDGHGQLKRFSREELIELLQLSPNSAQ